MQRHETGGRASLAASAAGLWAVAATAALLILGAPSARAVPVSCPVVGTEARCTGNQSAGISSTNEGISRLVVETLSTDIRPAANDAGITLENRGTNGPNGSNCGALDPTCDGGPGQPGSTGPLSEIDFAGGARKTDASGTPGIGSPRDG